MSSTAAGAAVSRRADLDALRGFAMLLGIALHAALSFFPSPWPVHDVRQSRWLGLFVVAVHGFRRPRILRRPLPGVPRLRPVSHPHRRLVVAVVTVELLAFYRWLVRDTLLSRLLDGPRPAAARATP